MGLLDGLLPGIYSAGDTAKRKLRGLLDDPSGTIAQFVGNENDRAGRLNDLTYESAMERRQRVKDGDLFGMGPKETQLTGLLADAYNPTGMFIGASAKTWDKAAAEQAQKLLKSGADPRQVWKETGTFKGADGALRQEIDDSVSSIKAGALPTKEINGQRYPNFKLADAMEHRPLFDAYPDTQGIEQSFQYGKSSSEYKPGFDWISLSDNFQKKMPTAQDQQRINAAYNEVKKFNQQPRTKRVDALMDGIVDKEGWDSVRLERVADRYAEPIEVQRGLLGKSYRDALDDANANPRAEFVLSPNAKSTQLHEIQHAIQQRENWARGGSPESFPEVMPYDRLVKRNYNMQDVYVRAKANGGIDPETGTSLQMAENAVNELTKQIKGWKSPDDLYRSLAGEAEARATQARMNMNAQQRREVYPFDSYDVPVDQLIVRGLLK